MKKNYGGFRLDSVSFALEKGRISGFIGRNGADKITTIKSLEFEAINEFGFDNIILQMILFKFRVVLFAALLNSCQILVKMN